MGVSGSTLDLIADAGGRTCCGPTAKKKRSSFGNLPRDLGRYSEASEVMAHGWAVWPCGTG
jgi:hypothetical protein